VHFGPSLTQPTSSDFAPANWNSVSLDEDDNSLHFTIHLQRLPPGFSRRTRPFFAFNSDASIQPTVPPVSFSSSTHPRDSGYPGRHRRAKRFARASYTLPTGSAAPSNTSKLSTHYRSTLLFHPEQGNPSLFPSPIRLVLRFAFESETSSHTLELLTSSTRKLADPSHESISSPRSLRVPARWVYSGVNKKPP
jgi:hypothetical protein